MSSTPVRCPNEDCVDGWIITEMSVRRGERVERWLDRDPCKVCRVHCEGYEIECYNEAAG